MQRIRISPFPIKFVPQQEAWVLERMGKYNRVLQPGLSFIIPFIDQVPYIKSLKETTVEIPAQSAITQDNVTLLLDGVLYYKIVDPYKASYGVEDPDYAVAQLAQTAMRSEIGRLTLDKCLAERANLNISIIQSLNSAALDWGIQCLRYEIRDIQPPANVVDSMHQQVGAERRKRAEILESEGSRQSAINVAEGRKQSAILESEALKMKAINEAKGDAEAVLLRAKASAESITTIAKAIKESGASGHDAVSLKVAEQYIQAYAGLAQKGTTMIVPSNTADIAGNVGAILKVFEGVKGKGV